MVCSGFCKVYANCCTRKGNPYFGLYGGCNFLTTMQVFLQEGKGPKILHIFTMDSTRYLLFILIHVMSIILLTRVMYFIVGASVCEFVCMTHIAMHKLCKRHQCQHGRHRFYDSGCPFIFFKTQLLSNGLLNISLLACHKLECTDKATTTYCSFRLSLPS